MLTFGIPAWSIAVRAATVYLAILFGLRLAGKREIGQMTVFDLAVLLLLSNAVQNAMVGADTSLAGGILAAAVLLLLNAVLAKLGLHSRRIRHLVEGTPTVLILHGREIAEHLGREGLDREMLEAALREHGVGRIGDVEMAVLEVDGSISVIPVGGATKRVRKPLKSLRH